MRERRRCAMDRAGERCFNPAMTRFVDLLSDEPTRTALGRRFEAATEEAFHVLRWTIVVGFARFLSLNAASVWFDVIHWATSGLLFGYLASRFLLRPEVPIFADRDRRWKRVVQTALNLVICMAAFVLVMTVVDRLVDGIAQYRFVPAAS